MVFILFISSPFCLRPSPLLPLFPGHVTAAGQSALRVHKWACCGVTVIPTIWTVWNDAPLLAMDMNLTVTRNAPFSSTFLSSGFHRTFHLHEHHVSVSVTEATWVKLNCAHSRLWWVITVAASERQIFPEMKTSLETAELDSDQHSDQWSHQ